MAKKEVKTDLWVYELLQEADIYMGHRTKRILRIERKEYQTY